MYVSASLEIMDSYAISFDDVQDAAKTIEGQAIVTPVHEAYGAHGE